MNENESVDDTMIKVWRFENAPIAYQKLSKHGGDEDWVAFIPNGQQYDWIGWMESGTAFGCCDVHEHEVPGGVVRIGAHA